MQTWQSSFLGLRAVPRDLSAFELHAFFTFDAAERRAIDACQTDTHKLGLALHIGFLRLSGRHLEPRRIVPPAIWHHLGTQIGASAPELASLKAMYAHSRTREEHQGVACKLLGITPMSEHQRRALVTALRDEVKRSGDTDQLIVFARSTLYRWKLLIPRERDLRAMVSAALAELEQTTSTMILGEVGAPRLEKWRSSLLQSRPDGQTWQSWLWAAPAKHSTRQITEAFERIEQLYALEVHTTLHELSDWMVTRYARRLAARPPSVGARIKEPVRTLETASFLRYCLLSTTDQLLLMVQRRIADIARNAASAVSEPVSWAQRYKTLLAELTVLVAPTAPMATELSPDAVLIELRTQLVAIIEAQTKLKAPSRASLIREQLINTAEAAVRSLLTALIGLPWRSDAVTHPVLDALRILGPLYEQGKRSGRHERVLPDTKSLPQLGAAWRGAINAPDAHRAFVAFEIATLFALRRAMRNGSVGIAHSLSFRGRARLFIPPERWKLESSRHYVRLSLPTRPAEFLQALIAKVRAGAQAVAEAARRGEIKIDDELHLSALPAQDEAPEITELRKKFDARIGSVQLPEVILAVDAQVRFSWLMLGREPRSTDELLMVYAGIMAHGTSLTAAECSRMIPQLSATGIRQAMRWATDERRLAQASHAVLEFMHRHPIAATWGRADLASSDMMSMETTKRVWQARMDPRRNTPSVGIYSHVRDRWGVFYAQPFVLNERQAGVAIEGVVRSEHIVTRQLAVDTHGYTDFAMALSRTLGFDLCPRLKELKQRHLFLPRGMSVPPELAAVCKSDVNIALIESHWDSLVNLSASVMTGHCSAVAAMARFGSAARSDPVYEAGVQLGRLLRTSFLADYFTNPLFRHELRRVLNRGEAVNAMKRSIYVGRIVPAQAKQDEEMQAVADALNLLANIVMAWNTMQMQAALEAWANRRQFIAPELTEKIAPTRLEGINLRGIFRFPTERYAEQLLPSQTLPKIVVNA